MNKQIKELIDRNNEFSLRINVARKMLQEKINQGQSIHLIKIMAVLNIEIPISLLKTEITKYADLKS